MTSVWRQQQRRRQRRRRRPPHSCRPTHALCWNGLTALTSALCCGVFRCCRALQFTAQARNAGGEVLGAEPAAIDLVRMQCLSQLHSLQLGPTSQAFLMQCCAEGLPLARRAGSLCCADHSLGTARGSVQALQACSRQRPPRPAYSAQPWRRRRWCRRRWCAMGTPGRSWSCSSGAVGHHKAARAAGGPSQARPCIYYTAAASLKCTRRPAARRLAGNDTPALPAARRLAAAP